jgi:hypothetical protein
LSNRILHGQRTAQPESRSLRGVVERAILATIDFAMASETESFDTPELRESIDRFLGR